MAQRPQRPQRPQPVPMPPPIEHPLNCNCSECLVLDAVRWAERNQRTAKPRVTVPDNPHEWRWPY
jgi:hypothetical protein